MNQPIDPDSDARNALRLIGPDPQNWVPERAEVDHNVTIVGGGQSGSAFAFALRRAGIGKVSVIDAAADEAQAGVWLTAARMHVLRTPKNLPGPELGIPALSFHSWYERRHGADAYATLERIPRTAWAEYLSWYRQFLAIPIRYGTRLVRIEPADGHLRLQLESDSAPIIETTRKVILANGVAGNGGAYVPPVLTEGLSQKLYAHTADAIDFAALRGKHVAVIGAAASAFDAAAVALETGAASVHLFARRPAIASVPITRVRGYPGAYDNYPRAAGRGSLAPGDPVSQGGFDPACRCDRAGHEISQFPSPSRCPVAVGPDRTMQDRGESGGRGFPLRLRHRRDRVFRGPGGSPRAERLRIPNSPMARPFRSAGRRGGSVSRAHPYLGAGHEYLEKVAGAAPHLKDIHVQNPAGFVSFGFPVGDVPSMKRGVAAVVSQIGRDLFFADFAAHERRITGDVMPEFGEELYASALWRP